MDPATQLGDLLLAVDHVGIAVPDLDAAVAFYTRTLGLRVAHRETNAEQQVEEVMLTAPEPGGAQLQLLAPTGPDSTIAKFLDRRGPGLQQLAFRVRSADLAAHALRMGGVRLLYDSSRAGTNGSRINFVHPKDAGGVLIELVELAGAESEGESDRTPDGASDEGDQT